MCCKSISTAFSCVKCEFQQRPLEKLGTTQWWHRPSAIAVNLLSLHAQKVLKTLLKLRYENESILLSAVCVQVEMELMGTQSHLFKGRRRKKWSWCSFPAVQWRWWKVRRHQMGWYTFILEPWNQPLLLYGPSQNGENK